MKLRMIVMLVLTGVVFGAVFGFKHVMRKGTNDYFNNKPIAPATISTSKAQAMQWPHELLSVGSIAAVNGTDVTTESEGVVRQIHFESGQVVAAGAVLVSLAAETEKAELERLRAQERLAGINLDRARDLVKTKVMSKSEYDARVAEADAAAAAVLAQSARVQQKQIRAPFAGKLGIRRVNLGQFVAKGTPVVSLQALDPIEVEFASPEQNISRLSSGLPVAVTVDAYPQRTFSGTLTVIEPKVEAATRNFRMRARLSNADGALLPGMFARVDIQLPGVMEVVAVPRTAVKLRPLWKFTVCNQTIQ